MAPNPVSERWVVLLDPRSVPVLFDELEEIAAQPGGEHTAAFTDLMLRLSICAAVAVEGLPIEFASPDGKNIGRVDVADYCCVFASDALALSCLSWLLRGRRTGFFLRL